MQSTRSLYSWGAFVRISGYTLLLLMIQIHWISRASNPALRVDLLLPLMFGVALRQSPIGAITWAFLWGYVADVLSGKFWGFHIVSYVSATCLVYIGSQKVEFHNAIYQLLFVGICSIGQSAVLGLFLWADPSTGTFLPVSVWNSLALRTLLLTLLSPLLIYPLSGSKKTVF